MNTIPSYVLGELAPKVLVSKGLLKPLGHPAPNAPKFFLTATLKDLERDEKWHGKVADAIQEYWRLKNGRKQGCDGQAATVPAANSNRRFGRMRRIRGAGGEFPPAPRCLNGSGHCRCISFIA